MFITELLYFQYKERVWGYIVEHTGYKRYISCVGYLHPTVGVRSTT